MANRCAPRAYDECVVCGRTVAVGTALAVRHHRDGTTCCAGTGSPGQRVRRALRDLIERAAMDS